MLEHLMAGDAAAIASATEALQAQGWFFLALSEQLVSESRALAEEMEAFFEKTPVEDKDGYAADVFGYHRQEKKEGFRCLTGHRLPSKLMSEQINVMAHRMDMVSRSVLEALCRACFGCSPELLRPPPCLLDEADSFGTLDVVYYYNFGNGDAPLVEPHFDAGLFSFSLFQTRYGLELQDRHGVWVPVPSANDVGVVWAGNMAHEFSKGKIQNGVHRVMPDSQPRLTIWYEVCSRAQVEHALQEEEAAESSSLSTWIVSSLNLIARPFQVVVEAISEAAAKREAARLMEAQYGLSSVKPLYEAEISQQQQPQYSIWETRNKNDE